MEFRTEYIGQLALTATQGQDVILNVIAEIVGNDTAVWTANFCELTESRYCPSGLSILLATFTPLKPLTYLETPR